MDAVHHLMCFALDLMTSGRIDDIVDAEYINSLEWYRTLPEILAGEADEDNGVEVRGEEDVEFLQSCIEVFMYRRECRIYSHQSSLCLTIGSIFRKSIEDDLEALSCEHNCGQFSQRNAELAVLRLYRPYTYRIHSTGHTCFPE